MPVQASEDDGKAANKRFAAFKFNSVGSQFKKQLAELMVQLNTMEPHYVRCIKPNGLNKAGIFENANALHQLRCGGVLEAVRISCAGFPNKRPFPDFVDHFWVLAPELYHSDADDRCVQAVCMSCAGARGERRGGGRDGRHKRDLQMLWCGQLDLRLVSLYQHSSM